MKDSYVRLTLLSLSLGGSRGSEAEVLGGAGEDAFGFSLIGASALSVSFSIFFSFAGGDGCGASLSAFSSDGATCVSLEADFDITATLVPGVTVSPSLATNCQQYIQTSNLCESEA